MSGLRREPRRSRSSRRSDNLLQNEHRGIHRGNPSQQYLHVRLPRRKLIVAVRRRCIDLHQHALGDSGEPDFRPPGAAERLLPNKDECLVWHDARQVEHVTLPEVGDRVAARRGVETAADTRPEDEAISARASGQRVVAKPPVYDVVAVAAAQAVVAATTMQVVVARAAIEKVGRTDL